MVCEKPGRRTWKWRGWRIQKDTSEINDTNESKTSKDRKEESVISSLLVKKLSLKVIQAVIFSIDTYKQDMIAVGNENQKNQSKTDGIIVIICPCYHCWGQIIVYPYFIWLNVLFGLMKQKNVLMNLKLDIWLIQIWILTKPSDNKWKKYMETTFGAIAQPFIRATLFKKKSVGIIYVLWDKSRKYCL